MKKTAILLFIASVLVPLPLRADSQTRAAQQHSPLAQSPPLPDGVRAREVRFYSEGIECYGKIFTPRAADGPQPGVVLAPDWGETATSIERFAAQFALRRITAMVIDYRGWGKSGGFVQTVGEVKTDDRLRFSQMTARVRIRRKRLIPQQQVLDIRNALYYLQGEPGVDRTRVGVWGVGMSGGHVIVIAATDSRVKAVVANAPVIDGKDAPRKASTPTGALLQAQQRLARTGDLGISVNDAETRLALAEYHPFWYAEQIPKTTAVIFVIADMDPRVKNESTIAASKLLKGPTDVVRVPGVTHLQIGNGAAFDVAAKTALDWFLKHL